MTETRNQEIINLSREYHFEYHIDFDASKDLMRLKDFINTICTSKDYTLVSYYIQNPNDGGNRIVTTSVHKDHNMAKSKNIPRLI